MTVDKDLWLVVNESEILDKRSKSIEEDPSRIITEREDLEYLLNSIHRDVLILELRYQRGSIGAETMAQVNVEAIINAMKSKIADLKMRCNIVAIDNSPAGK